MWKIGHRDAVIVDEENNFVGIMKTPRVAEEVVAVMNEKRTRHETLKAEIEAALTEAKKYIEESIQRSEQNLEATRHSSGSVEFVGSETWVCKCGEKFKNDIGWLEHSNSFRTAKEV